MPIDYEKLAAAMSGNQKLMDAFASACVTAMSTNEELMDAFASAMSTKTSVSKPTKSKAKTESPPPDGNVEDWLEEYMKNPTPKTKVTVKKLQEVLRHVYKSRDINNGHDDYEAPSNMNKTKLSEKINSLTDASEVVSDDESDDDEANDDNEEEMEDSGDETDDGN